MNGATLVGFGILILVIKSMFNNAKDKVENFVQDNIADTIIGGDIIGVRTIAGAAAVKWLKTCLWLRKDYRDWLTDNKQKTHLDSYNLQTMGAIQSEQIARDIIETNTVIFGEGIIDRLITLGLHNVGSIDIDHPELVIDSIKKIKNQVQALEVVEYYYFAVHKNLGSGLTWLPDTYIIQVVDYLKTLPTGASLKSNNTELKTLPIPSNLN